MSRQDLCKLFTGIKLLREPIRTLRNWEQCFPISKSKSEFSIIIFRADKLIYLSMLVKVRKTLKSTDMQGQIAKRIVRIVRKC